MLSEPEPGRLLVTFHSPGAALNANLHGRFLMVAAPTRGTSPSACSRRSRSGRLTELFDAEGDPYLWEAEDADFIDFIPAGLVLRGRFEEGDFFDWTATGG